MHRDSLAHMKLLPTTCMVAQQICKLKHVITIPCKWLNLGVGDMHS